MSIINHKMVVYERIAMRKKYKHAYNEQKKTKDAYVVSLVLTFICRHCSGNFVHFNRKSYTIISIPTNCQTCTCLVRLRQPNG